ncbi:MAG: NUDIX hydrolase [Bifidobacterium aquikefiri]|uniref:ADP-ribose pyrophosphatase n=1 Tax=Bifidobacterium aquikefiri TaxID=1653207 RepID=A0A261G3W4_9BIFI|nr:NUDIX hydrolase [Bifidobacterium aquikefiri]OZG66120.1 ADP-ribose pyrophosphatase [Bifidobacterium aquikefiri]
MPLGNVSERRHGAPDLGVSVVILALDKRANIASGLGKSAHHDDAPASNEVGRLWLPLVKRVKQPYLGCWALPGAGLRSDISLEDAAFTALESTTAMHPHYLEQLYTFGGPARSQGGLPMVSIVYWALVGQAEAETLHEANNVQWFATDALPEMAFDHEAIVDYALWRLRNKIEYSSIASRLVGNEFTLAQLRHVYEAVLGKALDPANFRRRMLTSDSLQQTGKYQAEGRHRPAALYRYSADTPIEEIYEGSLAALTSHKVLAANTARQHR